MDATTEQQAIDASAVEAIEISIDVGSDDIAKFELRRGGTGSVEIEDESAMVRHPVTIDFFDALVADALAGEFGEIEIHDSTVVVTAYDADHDLLHDAFFEQVNSLLDDRIIDPESELEGEPLTFRGPVSEEQFIRLVHLAQVAYMIASGDRTLFQTVLVADDDSETGAHLEDSGDDETPEVLKDLIKQILAFGNPQGYSMEHNDGPADRASGYFGSAEWIFIESADALESIPVREQVQAARVLVAEAKALGLDLSGAVGGLLAALAQDKAA